MHQYSNFLQILPLLSERYQILVPLVCLEVQDGFSSELASNAQLVNSDILNWPALLIPASGWSYKGRSYDNRA